MKGTLIHLHKRKRAQKKSLKKDAFPSPDSRIRRLDKIVMVVAIVFPFTTLPQLYDIWIRKSAVGLSLITWSLFFIFSIPLLMYGIVHKERQLIIMYSLWIVAHATIIIGILTYG
jgi:uncharacterized protein with PQ loop repeat